MPQVGEEVPWPSPAKCAVPSLSYRFLVPGTAISVLVCLTRYQYFTLGCSSAAAVEDQISCRAGSGFTSHVCGLGGLSRRLLRDEVSLAEHWLERYLMSWQ